MEEEDASGEEEEKCPEGAGSPETSSEFRQERRSCHGRRGGDCHRGASCQDQEADRCGDGRSGGRRGENGPGQQAKQENSVERARPVPGMDESTAGQEAKRQTDGKERRPRQKEEGTVLVRQRETRTFGLKDFMQKPNTDRFMYSVMSPVLVLLLDLVVLGETCRH